MNVATNKWEYVEQNGCHNCTHCKHNDVWGPNYIIDTLHLCGLDEKEIVLWGKCKKWEETSDFCEHDETYLFNGHRCCCECKTILD